MDASASARGAATLVLRAVRWPEDEAQLAALDTSFTTDRIYSVRRGELAFQLVEEVVNPPVRKSYSSLFDGATRLRRMRYVVVAEKGATLVGCVSADLAAWNNRVQVEDFFVAPPARRRGVGRALMESVIAFAREIHARCVWLETQNVNYPAVQFYRRLGFRLCGLDEHLYDPQALEREEIALFFVLDLTA